MSRYIDADPFKREMYHAAFETDTDMQRWDSGCWIRYKLFENVLEQQPTADVRKNEYGRWVIDGDCIDCSVCRREKWARVPFEDLVKRFKYCPNCGADMRGGSDESKNGGELIRRWKTSKK